MEPAGVATMSPSPTSCGRRTTPSTSSRRRALCDDVRRSATSLNASTGGRSCPSSPVATRLSGTIALAERRRDAALERLVAVPAVEQEAGRPAVQAEDRHVAPRGREQVEGVQQRAVATDGHQRVGLLDRHPGAGAGQLLEGRLRRGGRARQDGEAGGRRQAGGGRVDGGRGHRLCLPRRTSLAPHRPRRPTAGADAAAG